jgi:cyclophilin family peptidyl-prolyl cis-trans isomerase
VRSICILCLSLIFFVGCSKGPSGPNPQVLMETSMGNVKMELFQNRAPISVKNFLTYVDNRHYDETVFHRIIPTFMIQGGGMRPDYTEKSTLPPIQNESDNGLKNERGTLAMARTGQPHSATSQFFINVVDNSFLDRANSPDGYGYAVFGRVLDGLDVVDKIRDVPTGPDDVPKETVLIKSIRRVEQPKGNK